MSHIFNNPRISEQDKQLKEKLMEEVLQKLRVYDLPDNRCLASDILIVIEKYVEKWYS